MADREALTALVSRWEIESEYARSVSTEEAVNVILAALGQLEPAPACGCGRCDAARRASLPPAQRMQMFMIVCSLCGNKRCPHASWHGWECTRSNEPGQTPTGVAPPTAEEIGITDDDFASFLDALGGTE